MKLTRMSRNPRRIHDVKKGRKTGAATLSVIPLDVTWTILYTTKGYLAEGHEKSLGLTIKPRQGRRVKTEN